MYQYIIIIQKISDIPIKHYTRLHVKKCQVWKKLLLKVVILFYSKVFKLKIVFMLKLPVNN